MKDAKEYLEQLGRIKRQIAVKQRDAEMWREIANSLGNLNDGDRVQSSAPQDKMADAIANAVDYEKDARMLTCYLIDLQHKIITMINELEKPDHSMVLTEYYVHGLSIVDIATEWSMSCRSIKRKKADAIHEFSEKFFKNQP